MTNDQTAPRIWFAGPEERAQGIVAPLTDSPALGAPGAAEITLEYRGDTDTLVMWFGGIGPDGNMTPPRASAPIPAGLLFDLVIRRPKPPEGAVDGAPFASLTEHIEARRAEMDAFSNREKTAPEVQP